MRVRRFGWSMTPRICGATMRDASIDEPSDDAHTAWEEHYSAKPQVWSGRVNAQLAQIAGELDAGMVSSLLSTPPMLAEKRALLDLHARLARGEDLRCVLVRCSPRKLDDDNLASAFKAIRDEVAKQLGVDDGGDRVEWVYRQNVATLHAWVVVTIAAVTHG